MKVIKLFITVISCLMISGCQSSLLAQCFNSQPGDSMAFGNALAMSDNYLAVGDTQANRVIIYSRNKYGKWSRTREIHPLKDSPVYKFGSGFGHHLALDRNILVITGFTQKRQVNNPTDFQWTRDIYQTVLGQEKEVKHLTLNSTEELPDFFVTADKGTIAFITSKKELSGKITSKVNLLSDNQIYDLPSPTINYENEINTFIDIAIKDNLLLVANPPNQKTIGGAWLFNLNNLQQKPQWLTLPNAILGTTVAISERFAVVGELFGDRFTEGQNIPPKTLIKSIKNNSITVIDGYGKLSLDKNILARLRYAIPGTNSVNTLEVFRLDEDTTPHRIIKRKHIQLALVQNSFLTTVQKTRYGKKVCLDLVH
jgi:hypothetical protein